MMTKSLTVIIPSEMYHLLRDMTMHDLLEPSDILRAAVVAYLDHGTVHFSERDDILDHLVSFAKRIIFYGEEDTEE